MKEDRDVKTQFQYKNFDSLKTSVGLGKAAGRWGWGGEEQRGGTRSKGSFIYTGKNWAARQSIRKRPLSREAGQGGGWEGRMCYGQGGKLGEGRTQPGWSYNKTS